MTNKRMIVIELEYLVRDLFLTPAGEHYRVNTPLKQHSLGPLR